MLQGLEGFFGLIVIISVLLGLLALVYFAAVVAREAFRIALPYLVVFGIIIIVGSLVMGKFSNKDENFIERFAKKKAVEYAVKQTLANEPEDDSDYNDLKLSDDFYDYSDGDFEDENDGTSIEYIEKFVVSYGFEMVDAINYGDFSLVSNYLYPDSPLEKSQEKLVNRLYEKNITETVNTYRVDDIKIVSDEWAEVIAYEDIDVHRTEGTKNTAYYWKYKLKWNDSLDMYQMYSIHE